MNPYYEYRSDFKLDKDDIEGIQVHWTNILKFNRYKMIQFLFFSLMIHLKTNFIETVRDESVLHEILGA
jgi:hypothetical protein